MNIKLNTFRLVFSIVITLLPIHLLVAAEIDDTLPAKPAHLTDKKKSLQNRIQFPNLDGEIFVVLLCSGVVNANGRFDEDVFCIQDTRVAQVFLTNGQVTAPARTIEVDSDVDVTEVIGGNISYVEDRFEREVVEAARVSRIEPALVMGRNVPVSMNFAVIFEKTNGEESIDVFLHHFWNMDRFGVDYISAQLLGTMMDDELLGMADECPILENPILLKSAVNTEGFPEDVTLDQIIVRKDVSILTEQVCVDVYLKRFENNFYVPALYEGTYADSYHSGVVYQPANMAYDIDMLRESEVIIDRARVRASPIF